MLKLSGVGFNWKLIICPRGHTVEYASDTPIRSIMDPEKHPDPWVLRCPICDSELPVKGYGVRLIGGAVEIPELERPIEALIPFQGATQLISLPAITILPEIEPAKAPLATAVVSVEWWKKYLPWMGVGTLVVFLGIMLIRRK